MLPSPATSLDQLFTGWDSGGQRSSSYQLGMCISVYSAAWTSIEQDLNLAWWGWDFHIDHSTWGAMNTYTLNISTKPWYHQLKYNACTCPWGGSLLFPAAFDKSLTLCACWFFSLASTASEILCISVRLLHNFIFVKHFRLCFPNSFQYLGDCVIAIVIYCALSVLTPTFHLITR